MMGSDPIDSSAGGGPSDTVESVLQIDIETELAMIYLSLDRVDEGIGQAARALRLVDDLDQDGIEAASPALIELARVLQFCGALDVALSIAHRAYSSRGGVDPAERIDSALVVAECAIESAWRLKRHDEHDPQAQESIAELISIVRDVAGEFRDSHHRDAQLTHHWIRGECALLEGDHDSAQKAIEPLVGLDENHDEGKVARLRHVAGLLAQHQGQTAKALDWYTGIDDAFADDPIREFRMLRDRSLAYAELGDFERSALDSRHAAERADAHHVATIGSLSRQFLRRHDVASSQHQPVKPEASSWVDEVSATATRDGFDERLEERRHGIGDVAVLLFDVDRRGHMSILDHSVLDQAGELLVRECSEGDLVARLGENRFGVLPVEANLVKAHAFGERVRKAIDNEMWGRQEGELGIRVSAGASAGPAKLASDVLAAAELALAEAKGAERNCVVARRLEPMATTSRPDSNEAATR